MADYGGRGGGQSLRDALNFAYPMTGLGEYGAMFPPQTGAPQPGPPVPIPQPRPPQAGPQYLPPPGAALAQGSPGLGQPPVAPPLPVQAGLGIAGPPNALQAGGGLNMSINPNLMLNAGGNIAPGGNYGLRLGLNQRF